MSAIAVADELIMAKNAIILFHSKYCRNPAFSGLALVGLILSVKTGALEH